MAVLSGEKVSVTASGRTDSGVHAEGQVVNARFLTSMTSARLQKALNAKLPPDVSVLHAEEVPLTFHARYDAIGKIYVYAVWMGACRSPLKRARAYWYSYPVDIEKIKKGAALLTGKHDFRSFQSRADGKKSSVRTIHRLDIQVKEDLLTFEVEGDGFLYNMVRSLVGTLLELGRGKLTLKELKAILEAKDRRHLGPTAPPQGLTLKKVFY